MVIAALTGNYGTGKSTVLSAFARLGAVTISSDEIVADLLRRKTVVRRIVRLLGPAVLAPDGTLDKKAVAERVFSNDLLRKGLESIIHPLVFRKVREIINSISESDAVVVVEVPLLFEGNYQSRFDRVVTVFAAKRTCLARLRNTGIARREAERRLRTQLPLSFKKKHSDYIVDNNGSRNAVRAQVRDIYRKLSGEPSARVTRGRRRP